MLHHPERNENEVFVGNTTIERFGTNVKLKGLNARLGKVAYDIHGKKLKPSEKLFPLFISKHDYNIYDRRYGEELKAIKRKYN